MRVAFNARYLHQPTLRGLNRYTLCLLRALESLEEGIELYLLSEDRYPVHERYQSAHTHVENLPATRTLLWEQWTLPRYLRKSRPDVFHAPADGGLPLIKECPYVLTLHGVPHHALAMQIARKELSGELADYIDVPSTTGWYQSLRRIGESIRSKLQVRSADLIITVSDHSKAEIVRFLGVPSDRIQVIHEGVGDPFGRVLPTHFLEQVRSRHGVPRRFLLFVGGFDKRKNVPTLLRAFAQLQGADDRLGLVMVGIGGDLQGCRAESARLGLREGRTVFFLHNIPDLELSALYQAATLFVTLSWHEGFCLPIIEAMASGTPVLASSFGALPEIVGQEGCFVDPRNIEEIVGAIRRLLGDQDLLEQQRTHSLTRASAFSWRTAAESTFRLYQELARCA